MKFFFSPTVVDFDIVNKTRKKGKHKKRHTYILLLVLNYKRPKDTYIYIQVQ